MKNSYIPSQRNEEMAENLEYQRECISTARKICKELEDVIQEQSWKEDSKKLEQLMARRNQALDQAIPSDLNTQLHEDARQLLSYAQAQDNRLLSEAKNYQSTVKLELIKNKRDKKSVNAYQKFLE